MRVKIKPAMSNACNCGRAIKVPLPANGGIRVIGLTAHHAAEIPVRAVRLREPN